MPVWIHCHLFFHLGAEPWCLHALATPVCDIRHKTSAHNHSLWDHLLITSLLVKAATVNVFSYCCADSVSLKWYLKFIINRKHCPLLLLVLLTELDEAENLCNVPIRLWLLGLLWTQTWWNEKMWKTYFVTAQILVMKIMNVKWISNSFW